MYWTSVMYPKESVNAVAKPNTYTGFCFTLASVVWQNKQAKKNSA